MKKKTVNREGMTLSGQSWSDGSLREKQINMVEIPN